MTRSFLPRNTAPERFAPPRARSSATNIPRSHAATPRSIVDRPEVIAPQGGDIVDSDGPEEDRATRKGRLTTGGFSRATRFRLTTATMTRARSATQGCVVVSGASV